MSESLFALLSENDAIEVLREVRARQGRLYKRHIRTAWMNGNYNADCLDKWSGRLQQIRNQFGPTWLHRVRI
jgi:hypothetical protein